MIADKLLWYCHSGTHGIYKSFVYVIFQYNNKPNIDILKGEILISIKEFHNKWDYYGNATSLGERLNA